MSALHSSMGNVVVMEDVQVAGGLYTYQFTVQNVGEALPVWEMTVFHDLTDQANQTPAGDVAHPGWAVESGMATGTELAGPNGESQYTYTYDVGDNWPNVTPNGVNTGETLEGFSFQSATLDTAPLAFTYNVEGDWAGSNLGHNANNAQIFTGIGFTTLVPMSVPEPGAWLALMGCGVSFAALRRQRPRRQPK